MTKTPTLRRSGEQIPDQNVRRAAVRLGLPLRLTVAVFQGWKKVRGEGRCRMCERDWTIREPTRHHVVPRSWFKENLSLACLQDADANIVPLCRPCHADVERPGDHARIELRRLLRPDEFEFARTVAGRPWLDDRYPTRSRRPDPIEPSRPAWMPASWSEAADRVHARRRGRESRAL